MPEVKIRATKKRKDGSVKKTYTTSSDGTRTIVKKRRDGSVKKVKEFKAGKKKAYKTTKIKKSGLKKTKEYKKGVKGATITKEKFKKTLFGKKLKETTTTTRKERNRKRKKAVGKAVKGAAKLAGAGMAVEANPLLVGAAAKTGALAAAGAMAGAVGGSVVRGIKSKVRTLTNKMRNRKKNPNRKRL